jgi:hypothetical protein
MGSAAATVRFARAKLTATNIRFRGGLSVEVKDIGAMPNRSRFATTFKMPY